MPKTGSTLVHRETPVILAFGPDEAAAALRIARCRIFDLIRTGELPSYRVGRSRRISLRAIESYQQRLEAAEQGIRQQEGGRAS